MGEKGSRYRWQRLIYPRGVWRPYLVTSSFSIESRKSDENFHLCEQQINYESLKASTRAEEENSSLIFPSKRKFPKRKINFDPKRVTWHNFPLDVIATTREFARKSNSCSDFFFPNPSNWKTKQHVIVVYDRMEGSKQDVGHMENIKTVLEKREWEKAKSNTTFKSTTTQREEIERGKHQQREKLLLEDPTCCCLRRAVLWSSSSDGSINYSTFTVSKNETRLCSIKALSIKKCIIKHRLLILLFPS